MGTLRGDNGGDRPPDGDGLPNLPPEWGVVIIPDDVSELDREAARVRRELRRTARHERWRRRLRLGPPRRTRPDAPALGLPLLIMLIAIIATMTSLFALAWPAGRDTQPGQTSTRPTGTVSPPPVPDLALRDGADQVVRLRDRLPAVILLVDGCACTSLIKDTAAAVAPGVTVIAVAGTAPALPSPAPAGHTVIAVADRQGTLRSTYTDDASGVVAVLVDRAGNAVEVASNVTKVGDFRQALPAIA